jgi:hypothetical protein
MPGKLAFSCGLQRFDPRVEGGRLPLPIFLWQIGMVSVLFDITDQDRFKQSITTAAAIEAPESQSPQRAFYGHIEYGRPGGAYILTATESACDHGLFPVP